mgnify:CR=1 FL=1
MTKGMIILINITFIFIQSIMFIILLKRYIEEIKSMEKLTSEEIKKIIKKHKESLHFLYKELDYSFLLIRENIEDKEFKFIVDGIINRESERVDFKQDNKIINLRDGKSSILPNLIVDNNDIEASHSAYIGTFDEDKKFYMMSRGLSEKECDDLLIKAFLLSDMKLSEKERDIYCSIIENINK